MELTTSSVTEGWRIRIERPGQRDVRYLDSNTYPTVEDAEAAAKKYVQGVIDGGGRLDKTRIGVQWHRVEITKGECDWVHN